MHILFTIIFSVFAVLSPEPQLTNGTIDNISEAFREGDANKLSSSFSSNVEINSPTGEGVYSKAQAKQVIQKFFSKNKAVNSQIMHNGTSNTGSKFIVLTYETEKDTFRISIFLKQVKEDFLIQEIEIVKQL